MEYGLELHAAVWIVALLAAGGTDVTAMLFY